MEPLNLIYTIRIFLGALTAVVCLLLRVNDIFLAIMIAMLVYLGADKILKQIFIEKVEDTSVVTKTGIGIFIITWVLLWILLYTLLYAPSWP